MGVLSFMDKFLEDMKKIFCLFESVPRRIDNIREGVKEVSFGTIDFIQAIGTSATLSTNEILKIFEYIGILVFTHLECIMRFIINLYKCIWIYMIDLIGKILYLPVRLFLWILYIIYLDLYEVETLIWSYLETLDSFCKNTFGFHIIHFSKSIRETCYICKRLKSSVVSEQKKRISKVIGVTVPGILAKAGINKINRGARLFDESTKVSVRNPKYVK